MADGKDAKNNIGEKIKREIHNFKEKKKRVFGDPKITGVTKPHPDAKKDPKRVNEKKRKDAEKKQVQIGPRGGKYVPTATGKKRHLSSKEAVKEAVHKSLKEIIEDNNKLKQFVKSHKGDNNE